MKVGIRKPSIKRSISARTTGKVKRYVKKSVNPFYGKKGMGLVNDPKKAAYNAVYKRTTVSAADLVKPKKGKASATNEQSGSGGHWLIKAICISLLIGVVLSVLL